jgi:hypothetical protein
MANADRVLTAIMASPGSSDADLVAATGIQPHQQVNGICRRLAREGRIERRHRADGVLGNYPAGSAPAPTPNSSAPVDRPGQPARVKAPAPGPTPPSPAVPGGPNVAALPPARHSLIILPCSKAKRVGGQPGLVGPTVKEALQPATAQQLLQARAEVALVARLDERLLVPAVDRYTGFLHEAAAPTVRAALPSGQRFVILSGGYGVVHPHEPIGIYERAFHPGDWPASLLETALIEIAQCCQLSNVVAFCSRTTGYATLIRRTPRSRNGIRAFLVTPDAPSAGGSQRQVPMASGEALAAYLQGRLTTGWTSRTGLPLKVEAVR